MKELKRKFMSSAVVLIVIFAYYSLFGYTNVTLIDFKSYNPQLVLPFETNDVSLNEMNIILCNSSDYLINRNQSETKIVTNKDGETLLGIKVQMNNAKVEANSKILFPYDWSLVSTNTGFIQNIGQLRKVYLTVYSQNEPAKIGLIINKQPIEMGELNFTGKRTLMFNYPYDRESIVTNNYFSDDNLVLNGFYIQKFNDSDDGRIVCYIDNVMVEYDRSFVGTNSIDGRVWEIDKVKNSNSFLIEISKLNYNRDNESFKKIR